MSKLIKEPVIKYIDYNDLEQEREQNPKLLILDMRSAEEYNKSHIDGSRNIPFFTLRMSINELMQELGKQARHATSRNSGTPVTLIRSPTQRMGDALNALRP